MFILNIIDFKNDVLLSYTLLKKIKDTWICPKKNVTRNGGLQKSNKKIKVLVGLDSMGCNIFISRYNVKIPKGS